MSHHKLQTQKQWNRTPCGTGPHLASFTCGTREFFDEVSRSRYEDTDPWMKRTIDFSVARNKRLLEIGHGMGTDLRSFCEEGAEVYGIDITEEHHHLAKLNFETHGKSCTLKLNDGADIDFPPDYFDIAYSHGVLHHTPDTVRCISEVYRVLKPGGLFIMSVYHTYSAFHLCSKLFYEGVLRGRLRKLGHDGLMATVEHGADGVEIKPLVKMYRKGQLRHMLADFAEVRFKVAHFTREHIPKLGRLLPRFCERLLEPWLGWYLVAFATK